MNTAMPSLQQLADNLPVAIVLFQKLADDRIICRFANTVFESTMNYTPHAALGLSAEQISWLGDPYLISEKIRQCFLSGQPQQMEWQYADPPYDKHFRCRMEPLVSSEENASQVLVTLIDRTQEKAAERHQVHTATHDNLTGLPNRVLFTEKMEQAVEHASNNPSSQAAVLFLNVDRFKIINESLGHVSGDELLISLGRRLLMCVRAGDTLARLNSDEFAILVEDIDTLDQALNIAQRIHRELRNPFHISGQDLFATVSIGVATTLSSGFYSEELIRDADTAMHRAKARGGCDTEIFRDVLHQQARELFQLETDLRRAVARNELELHYQPLFDLQTGTIVGVEALARWHQAERGFISPAEFIPVAEKTGLIIPIGRWALQTACAQLSAWRREFGAKAEHLMVSVNVSGMQFARDDLATTVIEALSSAQLPGNRLKLEITESTIVENPDLANQVLRRLKALDVTFALDDFGTGYSSLSYLQRFPIDVLKIDRSFVANMLAIDDNYKIVTAILSLASNLGMDTVAEGIETAEQAGKLRELGCNIGQGFFFSKGLSSSIMTEFLETAFTQRAKRKPQTVKELKPLALSL